MSLPPPSSGLWVRWTSPVAVRSFAPSPSSRAKTHTYVTTPSSLRPSWISQASKSDGSGSRFRCGSLPLRKNKRAARDALATFLTGYFVHGACFVSREPLRLSVMAHPSHLHANADPACVHRHHGRLGSHHKGELELHVALYLHKHISIMRGSVSASDDVRREESMLISCQCCLHFFGTKKK